MKTKLMVLALLAGSTMFAGARVSIGVGIGVPYGGYYAPPPPPMYGASVYGEPEYDVAPPCPGPGYTWMAGSWYYNGPRRYWHAGYWRAPVYAPRYYAPAYGGGYYGGGYYGNSYRGGWNRHEEHDRWEHRGGGYDRGYRHDNGRHEGRGRH